MSETAIASTHRVAPGSLKVIISSQVSFIAFSDSISQCGCSSIRSCYVLYLSLDLVCLCFVFFKDTKIVNHSNGNHLLNIIVETHFE